MASLVVIVVGAVPPAAVGAESVVPAAFVEGDVVAEDIKEIKNLKS